MAGIKNPFLILHFRWDDFYTGPKPPFLSLKIFGSISYLVFPIKKIKKNQVVPVA